MLSRQPVAYSTIIFNIFYYYSHYLLFVFSETLEKESEMDNQGNFVELSSFAKREACW